MQEGLNQLLDVLEGTHLDELQKNSRVLTMALRLSGVLHNSCVDEVVRKVDVQQGPADPGHCGDVFHKGVKGQIQILVEMLFFQEERRKKIVNQ